MTGVIAAIAGGKGFEPLAVMASNVSRTQTGFASSGVVTSTQSPNTTPSGGVPPYVSFAWALVSGSGVSISSASAQNPSWSATASEGSPNVSTWRVTVTDSVSATAVSNTITVTLTWVQTA